MSDVSEPRESLVEILRGRVFRGLHAGTLEPGARLPSARELVDEFSVDHRMILAAYRELAAEGLVEIRERGGVYVASTAERNGIEPTLPVTWFVDTLTAAFAREIPADEVHEWLRRSVETLRLRAVVVSTTDDQVAGLARELRDDFGLLAEGIVGAELADSEVHSATLRRADVLITTTAQAELVEQLGAELGKPVITIDVRPDLAAGEWAMLLRQPVWAIVASAEFGAMLRTFFANVRGVENLRILVYGKDDLATIPEGAPTYVTSRVRESLGDVRLRGRILPAARTISVDSARSIFDYIVKANLRAAQTISSAPSITSPKRA